MGHAGLVRNLRAHAAHGRNEQQGTRAITLRIGSLYRYKETEDVAIG
jgi:hypothetical protein